MNCKGVTLPSGGFAIVCGSFRKRCSNCNRTADLLCDWKVPSRKSGTCDKPICARCTTKPAPEKDLCTAHAEAWRKWKVGRS